MKVAHADLTALLFFDVGSLAPLLSCCNYTPRPPARCCRLAKDLPTTWGLTFALFNICVWTTDFSIRRKEACRDSMSAMSILIYYATC